MKKLIKKSFHRKEKGFTLIELLLVIAIIGILSGAVITVINPVRQQNRTRNATIRSSVSKVASAVNTVKAGIGTLPSNAQLTVELENITPNSVGCASSPGTLNCLFSLPGTALPKYCAVNSADPTGTNPCFFRIISAGDSSYGNLTAGKFRVGAAIFDLDTQVHYLIIFDSSKGLLMCGPTTPWATAPTTQLTVVPGPNPGSNNCVILSE
jgi:prepilin-type N-terminal cleavage/methylation domain-containing protein